MPVDCSAFKASSVYKIMDGQLGLTFVVCRQCNYQGDQFLSRRQRNRIKESLQQLGVLR